MDGGNQDSGAEHWPLLEGNLKSIIANRKSPSDLSRKKFKGLKAMLKMPKDQLKRELLWECGNEARFLQSLGKSNPTNHPIHKPSSIAIQFMAMNDIKPLKKVYFLLKL